MFQVLGPGRLRKHVSHESREIRIARGLLEPVAEDRIAKQRLEARRDVGRVVFETMEAVRRFVLSPSVHGSYHHTCYGSLGKVLAAASIAVGPTYPVADRLRRAPDSRAGSLGVRPARTNSTIGRRFRTAPGGPA